MLKHLASNREVLNLTPSIGTVLCPCLLVLVQTQEVVALFQHDRKIVEWDVKSQ